METGPEPQELFENVEQNKHRMEHSESKIDKHFVMKAAVTASMCSGQICFCVERLISIKLINMNLANEAKS